MPEFHRWEKMRRMKFFAVNSGQESSVVAVRA